MELRRKYSVSKRLFKPTRLKNFLLELSGHQDIPPLLFVLGYLLQCVGWVFISARSVENCNSVERLNTVNNEFQSIPQNVNEFAAG